MWRLLMLWLDKKACHHKWELHKRINRITTYQGNSSREEEYIDTLICENCGKIEKIYLS